MRPAFQIKRIEIFPASTPYNRTDRTKTPSVPIGKRLLCDATICIALTDGQNLLSR